MSYHHRIAECEHTLANGNLSLATRRAMDLTLDFTELSAFRTHTTNIRKTYNLQRELGESELSGDNSSSIAAQLHEVLLQMQPHLPDAPDLGHSIEGNAVEGQQVSKRFSNGGHRFELGPLDIELKSGSITGVVGENGNGKTTLLRILAGDLRSDSGQLVYPGLDRQSMPKTHYEVKQQTAFIPQRLQRWNGTLLQNLKFAAAMHGLRGQENEDRVDFVVHRFGLTRFQHLKWKQLSSGYKLRFELAKMVVWFPRFLVLDEPVANLDLVAQQLFLQDLRHLAESVRYPLGIIMSSQQLHAVEQVADDLIFLKNGKPLFMGPVAAFGTQRKHNTFEVSGAFTAQQIAAITSQFTGTRVDDNGIAMVIDTPLEVSASQLLQLLISHNIELTYFRDISSSTRQLLSE